MSIVYNILTVMIKHLELYCATLEKGFVFQVVSPKDWRDSAGLVGN
jgi:hypothetical protein